MTDMIRKHFILRRDVAEEFDRVAGERKQSEKLGEILERWLKNQRLLGVVNTYAGFVTAEDHPEWATAQDANNWVRELRASGWQRTPALTLKEEQGDGSVD